MTDFYERWQTKNINAAMKTRRVLLLTGARQCGKTTLARALGTPTRGKETEYRTLDDTALRQLARSDPRGFVRHTGKTLIIDEVQRAPALLSAIKMVVDQNLRPGQFLLTGSANIQAIPAAQESLAGRISKIRLRPLTQGEILRGQPRFLAAAFRRAFHREAAGAASAYHRDAVLDMAFRGGFPEAVALKVRQRRQWHRDYMAALLDRDLRDIAHITRRAAMRDLVGILAAWSGKLMDISAIGAGLSIQRPTIESYINALEALFIVERIPPWTQTDYGRVGRQTKLFMTDGGLMASLLRWNIDQVRLDADRSGKLIETFVFNELAAQVDAADGLYELFHYRDREQREIDFMIQRDDGALLGIEVKAGSAIGDGDFRHLKWFRDNIAKDRKFTGIVLYTGDYAGSMGKGLWAVPFGMLWG